MELDGVHIASRGAVMININHLLNAYGFLARPDLSVEVMKCATNFSFLDQQVDTTAVEAKHPFAQFMKYARGTALRTAVEFYACDIPQYSRSTHFKTVRTRILDLLTQQQRSTNRQKNCPCSSSIGTGRMPACLSRKQARLMDAV